MICKSMKTALALSSVLFSLGASHTVQASQMAEIPVLNRAVEAGELIDAKDISIKPINASTIPTSLITSADDLVGREAVRSLRPGLPVQMHHVRIPPEARRGEEVVIRYQNNGILLEAKGRALEDGNQGDTIKVMNVASSKILAAVVLSDGLVRISH